MTPLYATTTATGGLMQLFRGKDGALSLEHISKPDGEDCPVSIAITTDQLREILELLK